MAISLVAVDLSKSVFQLSLADANHHITGLKRRCCQLNDIQTAQRIDGFIPLPLGYSLSAGHLLAFTKCPRTKLPIVDRSRQMPAQLEQIPYHAIHCKEALSLSR